MSFPPARQRRRQRRRDAGGDEAELLSCQSIRRVTQACRSERAAHRGGSKKPSLLGPCSGAFGGLALRESFPRSLSNWLNTRNSPKLLAKALLHNRRPADNLSKRKTAMCDKTTGEQLLGRPPAAPLR